MDIFSLKDPEVHEIKTNLDDLSTSMARYQNEYRLSFSNIRTDICLSEMQDEHSLLDGLEMMNDTFTPEVFESICGPRSFSCVQAFFSVADAIPRCADRFIESSTF